MVVALNDKPTQQTTQKMPKSNGVKSFFLVLVLGEDDDFC